MDEWTKTAKTCHKKRASKVKATIKIKLQLYTFFRPFLIVKFASLH